MYNIIGKRKIWFIVSVIIIIIGVVYILLGGLKLGIDFTGGSLLELEFTETRPNPVEIKEAINDLDLGDLLIQPIGDKGVLLKMKNISNETRQKIIDRLMTKGFALTEKSFESIGPAIGSELKRKALTAIGLVLVGIILYVTWAFRKISEQEIASWQFGINAIIALIHDILIVTGIFAILGYYFNVEVDIFFVTALLTILGFSVHDTIVVFDRIREGLRKYYEYDFETIVNKSINETIVRSINTSFTTFLVLLALYLFGGESIRFFVLALIIGVIVGTYSSIFIASALLVAWYNLKTKRQ